MLDLAAIPHAAGNLASRHNRLHLARLAYGLAIWFRPDRAISWMKYGKCLRKLGREKEGIDALQRALALDPRSHAIGNAAMEVQPRSTVADRIGFVILGTTGRCNASCIHCPTGKQETAHVPRTPMPMPLFHKIIDDLYDCGLPITGQIAFGLFGDALVDPHVVERARYVRDRFPTTPISVNSNAAAFNRTRHAELRNYDVTIGLHSESIVKSSFDHLMQPLKLERVLPKYEEILDLFAGRVHVSIPVSKANLAHIAQTCQWFEDRGAEVLLAPMMSRCADDLTTFRSLAFRPLPMRCDSTVLDDLVIDCDGAVLRCCQDFKRTEPIANITDQSLREILHGPARRNHVSLLDEGRHLESATCSKCFGDPMNELGDLISAHSTKPDAGAPQLAGCR